jgi:hypothetical protein
VLEGGVRPMLRSGDPVSLTSNPRVSLPGTLPRLLNALSAIAQEPRWALNPTTARRERQPGDGCLPRRLRE